MKGCCGSDIRKAVAEIKDALKDIDQKISHLIEQNREERHIFVRDREENNFKDDEDDG